VSRTKEIAKFAAGAESFTIHAVFWLSGGAILFGITLTPTLNIVGALVNAVFALFLASTHGARRVEQRDWDHFPQGDVPRRTWLSTPIAMGRL
jgi:hypothetical protein